MPTDAEIEIVSRRIKALREELDERRVATTRPDERPQPRHLTPLQLALAARARGLPLRPDLARALAEDQKSGRDEIQSGDGAE